MKPSERWAQAENTTLHTRRLGITRIPAVVRIPAAVTSALGAFA